MEILSDSQYADDVGKYNDLKKEGVFFKRPLAKNLCLCFMSKAQKTLVYYVLSFLLASWPVHHLIPFQDPKPGRVVELGLQNME